MSGDIEKQVASLLKKTNDGVQSTPKVVEHLVHEYQILSIWETILCLVGAMACVLALWWVTRQCKKGKAWATDRVFKDDMSLVAFTALIVIAFLLLIFVTCLFFTIPGVVAPDISLLNNIFGGY